MTKIQLVRFPEMSSVLCKVTGNGQDAANRCVIIGIAKADSSGSVIYAMKINSDGSFEGDPFQLRQENGLYIWPNEKIAENRISFGSIHMSFPLYPYRTIQMICEIFILRYIIEQIT